MDQERQDTFVPDALGRGVPLKQAGCSMLDACPEPVEGTG